MPDDWRVDDLALCISRHERYPPEIRPGAVLTVREVIGDMADVVTDHHGMALRFRDAPDLGPQAAYCARRFRKITPRGADAFDREVIDIMTEAPVDPK